MVALGGGVVGDLAGFAAATYLRGIPFVQIPTTFLAAIDSSVGGKTAVNIPAGKNLVGAFHQPSLVICDPDTFKTLPEETFADGCAEMIKYAMIWSEDFLKLLESCDIHEKIEKIVAYCVDIKRQVVEQDEHDTALRMILNYGHTLGHAIEKVTNHAVTHGHGVAMGMVLITRVGIKLGLCDRALLQRLTAVLTRYHRPTVYGGSVPALSNACLHDKKRAGSKIRLILVRQARQGGDCADGGAGVCRPAGGCAAGIVCEGASLPLRSPFIFYRRVGGAPGAFCEEGCRLPLRSTKVGAVKPPHPQGEGAPPLQPRVTFLRKESHQDSPGTSWFLDLRRRGPRPL